MEKSFNSNKLLVKTVDKKREVIEEKKDRARFRLGIYKARLQKLARIQETRKIQLADEFTMTKSEVSQTTKEINDLGAEIGKALMEKTLNEEELEKLEIRLKSLEAILLSADNNKN